MRGGLTPKTVGLTNPCAHETVLPFDFFANKTSASQAVPQQHDVHIVPSVTRI